MDPSKLFLWGFSGSLAIETITIYQAWSIGRGQLPERYRSPLFWVVRFCVAVTGGGLALAYDVSKPIVALNIGVAAPIILQAMAKGLVQPEHGPIDPPDDSSFQQEIESQRADIERLEAELQKRNDEFELLEERHERKMESIRSRLKLSRDFEL